MCFAGNGAVFHSLVNADCMCFAGNGTVYHSPVNADYYGLRLMTRSVQSVVWRVKSCNQAQVTLSDIPGIITERTLEGELRAVTVMAQSLNTSSRV